MLKKIEKLRNLSDEIENHLEESRDVIKDVVESLESALSLVDDIKDMEIDGIENLGGIENLIEVAMDKISSLGNAL